MNTTSTQRDAMSRRTFLGTCAATGLATLAPRPARAAVRTPRSRRPNIIMVSTDQWHAQAFSHYGNPWLKTPNSDRIFQRGTSFSRAYAADPVCAPARTSWITGRMPQEHRVIGNGFPILEGMPDFGQWFTANGYQTVHLGKWHTSNRNPGESFDINYGMHPAGQYADHSVAQMARSYLLDHDRAQPFLMHVALMNPHDICQVGCMRSNEGRLPGISLDDLPPLPDNFTARPTESAVLNERVRRSHRRSASFDWDETDWRLYRWMYYRYCEQVDASIGIVMDALEASGQADNTLVVYTSDHGEGLGHHGLYTKAFLYDSAARVPFVACFPGRLAEGAVDDRTFVSGVDLFPTFCDVAGIEPPPDLCGENFLEQHTSGERKREALCAHASFGGRMIVDDTHKLIRYEDDPTVQLFDLANDPGETRNIAEESPARVGQLQDALSDFEARLKPFPMPPGGISELWRTYNQRK